MISNPEQGMSNKDLSPTEPTISREAQSHLFLLVPSNDTHVSWMRPVAEKLSGEYAFMVIPQRKEGAEERLSKQDRNDGEYYKYQPGLLQKINPTIILLGNDWSIEEQQILVEARILGIPSVVVQEGILEITDPTMNRLRNADYAFLQGEKTLKHMPPGQYFVTGNPRYDSMKILPLPEQAVALVNCNFTYHIYEDIRDWWLKQAVGACAESGVGCLISQHPRDHGTFPPEYHVIKSNAYTIKEQMAQTSILITRFSTLVYEAVAMGREVIYFNPHGEESQLLQDDTGALLVAHDYPELVSCLRQAVGSRDETRARVREEFLRQNIGTLEHDAAERIANQLRILAEKHSTANKLPGIWGDKLYPLFTQLLNRLEAIKESRNWFNMQWLNWQQTAEEQKQVIQEQRVWISELERGKDGWKEQVRSWQQNAHNAQGYIAELEKGKAWYEEQISNYRHTLDEKEKALSSLEIQKQEHDKTLHTLQNWIGELEKSKNWLAAQAQNRQQEIEDLRAWAEELEKGKQWLDEQREHWQTQCEKQLAQIATLQKWAGEQEQANRWLEEQRHQWESLALEYQQRNHDLKHELASPWLVFKRWLKRMRP
jgi:hypothetical protein